MWFLIALLFTLTTGRVAWGANPVSYTGDFNGDGWPDLLLQPADATGQVQIILADSAGDLTIPGQSWSADYLGLHWSADNSQLVIGDFTGNGRDDVLVQPLQSSGTGGVLLSDANGQFHAVTQLIANSYMGLDWSAASHTLVVGDFTGNGRQDLLLQTATPGGMNLIAEPSAQGVFNTTGQSWPDGYLGLQWSSQEVTLYPGDFTGNGQSDLLVQVNDPVSNNQVPAYALLLADGNGEFTQINQSWGVSAFGADWSPATHTLSIQDVTGTGMDDIVLMAKDPTGTNYLFLGNQTGTFSKPDLTWTGTESAKTAWANKMAADQSVAVTTSTQSSSSKLTAHTTAQPRAMTAQATQTPNAVGDMGGQSGVNGGAATYAIPIVAPPGRAGMQPSLSLDYSSRGGNGVMGMGWSLSGLSTITRCPETVAQDGTTLGVTYSASTDRLCLDGQHLIAVSGVYGQAGSVYRTEVDSQVRITLESGSINSTGAYFEVDYENGNRAFYGIGTNTQFIASGASYPLVWAIGQEEDLAGNNVVYNYQAYGSGEYHVSSIVYTGSSSGTTITSTGNREVDFIYHPRNDPSTVYLAGGLTQQTQLLTQITTKAMGNVVRQWTLGYSTSAATGRSLLTSVQGCGYASGSSSLSCLSPDNFNWQDAPLSFSFEPINGLPDNKYFSGSLTIAGDYLGDGQRSLYYSNPKALSGPTAELLFVNSNGANQCTVDMSTQFSGSLPYAAYVTNYDFFNTGRDDLLGLSSSVAPTYFEIGYIPPNITPTCSNLGGDFKNFETTALDTDNNMAVGDFVGNGYIDIVADANVNSTTGVYLYPNMGPDSSGQPQFGSPILLYAYPAGSEGYFQENAEDLDGNGLPDLWIGSGTNDCPMANEVLFINGINTTTNQANVTLKTMAQMGINYSCSAPTHNWFMDITGDGLLDYVYIGPNNDWWYQLNQGGTFAPAVDTGVGALDADGSSLYVSAVQVADVDNSGADELLIPGALIGAYCQTIQTNGPDGPQPDTLCGEQLIGSTVENKDRSVYQYNPLKFVAQANGTYTPELQTGITLDLVAHDTQSGDLYGLGLTDFFAPYSPSTVGGSYETGCGAQCSFTFPSTAFAAEINTSGAPDLMTSATNGLGAQSQWQYQTLAQLMAANNPRYTVAQPCSTVPDTSDYYCFTSSMYVVSDYKTSNDTGGLNDYSYAYADAIYNNKGRGFQGFKQITVYFAPENDPNDATTTVNTYNQGFPTNQYSTTHYPTLPIAGTLEESTVTQTSTGNVLSDTKNVWVSASPGGSGACLPSSAVFFSELTQSTVIKNGTSGENISNTTTNYSYDGNGNVSSDDAAVSDFSGTYSSDTTNTYNPSLDCTDWWPDELQQKQVVLSVNYLHPIISNPGSIARTANYSYTSLRKIQEEYDDQGSVFEKDTIYGYDSYGNTTNVQVSSGSKVPAINAIVTRSTAADFSGTGGYFADSLTNALGQVTTIQTDPDTGLPTSVSDPNGVTTISQYDAFGRKILEQVTAPISLPATLISYQVPTSVCPSGSVYLVSTSRVGSPSQTVCYDLLNHPLRTITDGFTSGQPSYRDTQYDVLGRVIASSEPYFNGATPAWTTLTYDVLNRVLTKTDPEKVATAISYNGLTATATTSPTADPSQPSMTTVTTTNSLGKLLSTVDANGSDTEFRYDVQGNPVLIQDAAGHQTLATYNLLGQKTAVTDPDMGNWTYVYDVLGNLVQQTDAKSQVMTQTFDPLNRMTSRTQPEGTTLWCYDGMTVSSSGVCTGTGAVPDLGKLTAIHQYDGYQKTYTYDGDGRVTNVEEVINSNTYDTSTTYDSDGRLSTMAYPAGVSDQPPTADAGSNQTVLVGATVTLDGSGSSEASGAPQALHYQWTQTAGPVPVTLSGATSAQATFTAGTAGVFTFQLVVSDGLQLSAPAGVSITVQPQAPGGLSLNESTSTDGSYIVSWGSSTGAATYDLLESTDGGASYTNQGAATSPDHLSGKGSMSANITYTYEAEGCANSVCGPPSNSASVLVTLPPTAPGGVTLPSESNWNGSFTVGLGGSTGVNPIYTVELGQYINGSSGPIAWLGGSNICTSSTTSCTYPADSVTAGSYRARAEACNQTACSGWTGAGSSITVQIISVPNAPTLSGGGAAYNDNVTMTWSDSSTPISSYNLYGAYKFTSGGSYGTPKLIYSGTATSYTDTLGSGEYSEYYATACNQAGCSSDSNVVTAHDSGGHICKTCAPTGGVQTPAPSPSTAPAPGTSSPSASTPPSGTDQLASAAVPPVGAMAPVAMAATVVPQAQISIPALSLWKRSSRLRQWQLPHPLAPSRERAGVRGK